MELEKEEGQNFYNCPPQPFQQNNNSTESNLSFQYTQNTFTNSSQSDIDYNNNNCYYQQKQFEYQNDCGYLNSYKQQTNPQINTPIYNNTPGISSTAIQHFDNCQGSQFQLDSSCECQNGLSSINNNKTLLQISTRSSINSFSSPHKGFEIYHKQYSIDEDEDIQNYTSNHQDQAQQIIERGGAGSLSRNREDKFKKVEFGVQLLRPVLERANYYLIGDFAIDFELIRGGESRFSPLSEFRPVLSVERNMFQEFIELKIGQYQQGMTDFRGVIEKLNSMNDQFAHGIAVLLTKYQKLIDFKVKMQKKVSSGSSQNSFDLQAFWEEAQAKVENILIEKKKENKYLGYIVKRGSYLEDVMVTQGFSEAILEVLGLTYETFSQISLRKGLIDFVEPMSRYFIIVEQFANVATKKMPWEDICLISIDNFKIPVRVKAEKITLNKYKCYENYLGFLNIDISQKVLDDLRLKRYRARHMLENKNYFQLGEELTYSFETELFLDRYYSQQKAQALIDYSEKQKKKNEEDDIEVAKVLQKYINQYEMQFNQKMKAQNNTNTPNLPIQNLQEFMLNSSFPSQLSLLNSVSLLQGEPQNLGQSIEIQQQQQPSSSSFNKCNQQRSDPNKCQNQQNQKPNNYNNNNNNKIQNECIVIE